MRVLYIGSGAKHQRCYNIIHHPSYNEVSVYVPSYQIKQPIEVLVSTPVWVFLFGWDKDHQTALVENSWNIIIVVVVILYFENVGGGFLPRLANFLPC